VKRAIDRLSAHHLPVAAARSLIRERAAEAVANVMGGLVAPEDADGPVEFEIEFRSTSAAQMCTLFPGVERRGPNEIAFQSSSYIDAYRQFWGLGILGMAATDGVFGTGL
jgi:D-aminopeptidase